MSPFSVVNVILLLWHARESSSFLGGVLPGQPHLKAKTGAVLGANCTGFLKQLSGLVPRYCEKYIVVPDKGNEGVTWVQPGKDAYLQGKQFNAPEAMFCFGLYDAHAELCGKDEKVFGNITSVTLKASKVGAEQFCNTTSIAFRNYRTGKLPGASEADTLRNTWATELSNKLSNPKFCDHHCVDETDVRVECINITRALLLLNKTSHPAEASQAQQRELPQMLPSPPELDRASGSSHKSSSIPLGPSDFNHELAEIDGGAKTAVKPNIEESGVRHSVNSPDLKVPDPEPKPQQPAPLPAASTEIKNKPAAEAGKPMDKASAEAPPFGEGPEIGGEPEQQSDPVQPEDQIRDDQILQGNDDQPDGPDPEQPKQPEEISQAERDKMGLQQQLNEDPNKLVLMDKNNDDSNLMTNFLLMFGGALVLCIAFCNKKKLLALALEGRRTHRRGDRHHSASYSKLHSNLEEAIVSGPMSPSTTHVLY